MTLAEAMLEFRANNNLSMQECAKMLGVSYGVWQAAESGTRKTSRVNELKIKKLLSGEIRKED